MVSELPDQALYTDMIGICISNRWERRRQAVNRPNVGPLFLPATKCRAMALGYQPQCESLNWRCQKTSERYLAFSSCISYWCTPAWYRPRTKSSRLQERNDVVPTPDQMITFFPSQGKHDINCIARESNVNAAHIHQVSNFVQ